MRRARVILLVALGVGVILAGVLAWRALGPSRRPPTPVDFVASDVPTDSPRLAIETEEVSGVVRNGSTQWRCSLRCREPRGCYGQLRVSVHYLSRGGPRRVTFVDLVRADAGEVAVLGGSQRPAEPVDSIERLEVVVEKRLADKRATPVRFQ